MESAELLDLLGNDTRRRILALLARKPCYVTEISEVTGVSPKAVIDHLTRLEEAGLIEYRHADDRRKYFSITTSQRLEITIAPHQFGTKNGYLPPESIDAHEFTRLSLDPGRGTDVDDPWACIERLEELEELAAELSCAQRFVHGEVNRLYGALVNELFEDDGARLGLDILEVMREEGATVDDLVRRFSVSTSAIQRCLDQLEAAGMIREGAAGWELAVDGANRMA